MSRIHRRRRVPRRAGAIVLLLVAMAAGPVATTAGETCYRSGELRADVEAQLADLLTQGAWACSNAARVETLDALEAFEKHPGIAAGRAEADARRAPYYQRLYGGDDWKTAWEVNEVRILSYAEDVLVSGAPSPAGCARLVLDLVRYTREGWPGFSAAVDRYLATHPLAAERCAE